LVYSDLLRSSSTGGDIPNSFVTNNESSVRSNCSTLDLFVGNLVVKRLNQLIPLQDNSPVIVIGWYDSVIEGIDMWYPDYNNGTKPRLDGFYYFMLHNTN
jgi:hypothetical protein